MSNDGKKVLSNFIWRFLERSGAQCVAIVVSIILARILSPKDYGTIALITVFINIFSIFVNCGFGTALIQKKDSNDSDFSSVFFLQMILCVAVYVVLFALSPAISAFYERTEMIPMIRVLALSLIISGVKNIQIAYVSKHMLFKKFFFATLGGTLGSAVVGISFAYAGFGVWALIYQNLFNETVDTIILWLLVKWRPQKQLSFQRIKTLFCFGWKLLVSSLIDVVYNNLRSLLIGKVYSSDDLAYYDQGLKWPMAFISNINTAIDSVLLPTLSQEQDRKIRVKQMTRRAIITSTYILSPILIGLVAIAEPFVKVFLTEKWLPCVPYMRIFCICFVFYPVHTANLNAIKAMGRSDYYLKLEIIKKTIGVLVLILSLRISVLAIACGVLLTDIICQFINCWPHKRLINYKYSEQLKDIFPNLGLALFMGICVYCISYIGFDDLLTLIIQIVVGIVVYFIGSVVLKNESYLYLTSIIKTIKDRKHK